MRKLTIILAFVFLLALSFSSCRSTRPPCPAYTSIGIENIDNRNISK